MGIFKPIWESDPENEWGGPMKPSNSSDKPTSYAAPESLWEGDESKQWGGPMSKRRDGGSPPSKKSR